MKRNALLTVGRIWYSNIPLIVLAITLLLLSCKKEVLNHFNEEVKEKSGNGNTGVGSVITIDPCGSETTVNLIAGQYIDIGSVEIANTEDSLYITITSEGNWWVQAANVYVGSLSGMPQTPNGNPKVGQFPYKKVLNPTQQVVQFAIPLSGLPACYSAAIHVEACRVVNGQIVQSETGWGQGSPMPGDSWAMYVPYCTQECNPCTSSIYTVIRNTQGIDIGEIEITNNEDSVFVTVNLIPNWFFRKIYVYAGTYANMPNIQQSIPNVDQFPIRIPMGSTLQNITVGYPIDNFPPCYILAVHADVINSVNGTFVLTDKAWGYGIPFTSTTQWGWTIPYCNQACDEE